MYKINISPYYYTTQEFNKITNVQQNIILFNLSMFKNFVVLFQISNLFTAKKLKNVKYLQIDLPIGLP